MKAQVGFTQKKWMAALLATFFLLSAGCAKKSDDGGSADPVPTTTDPGRGTPVTPGDTDTPRGTGFTTGATAPLQFDSLDALTGYVGNAHAVNAPKDVRISVKLTEAGAGKNMWGGDVYVSYQDNGQYFTGHFIAKNTKNPTSGTLYPGWYQSSYNAWFNWNGRAVFHGFYQDAYGAVMLVIDQYVDQGDGSGATEVGGSIWYKNFANSQFQYADTGIPCWFITAGPYDCRTFLQAGGPTGDGNIAYSSALFPPDSQWYTTHATHPYIPEEPARGWRRLGTFSGLNKAKAFSQ